MDATRLREHTLNRLGHGPSTWHAARYDELGFDAFVAEQLEETLDDIEYPAADAAGKLDRSTLSRRQLEVGLLDFMRRRSSTAASSG